MVCYAVLLGATVLTYAARRFSRIRGPQGFWLNIMFLGGALFGVIDHAWNGELFLLGQNIFSDLALGFTITGVITAGWGLVVFGPKIAGSLRELGIRLNIMKR